MGFKILMENPDGGEYIVLHEVTDRRVTRVGLTTRNGEAAGARIDLDQGEVLLTMEYVNNDGRPTIWDAEAALHPTMDGDAVDVRRANLAELSSATNSGDDILLSASKQSVEEEPAPADDTPEDEYTGNITSDDNPDVESETESNENDDSTEGGQLPPNDDVQVGEVTDNEPPPMHLDNPGQ